MVGHSELRSNIPHNVLLVNNQTVDGSLGCVDDLSFSYDSNRLVKVSDRAEAPPMKALSISRTAPIAMRNICMTPTAT